MYLFFIKKFIKIRSIHTKIGPMFTIIFFMNAPDKKKSIVLLKFQIKNLIMSKFYALII